MYCAKLCGRGRVLDRTCRPVQRVAAYSYSEVVHANYSAKALIIYMPFLPCYRRLPTPSGDALTRKQPISKRSFLLAVASGSALGAPRTALAEDVGDQTGQIARFSDSINQLHVRSTSGFPCVKPGANCFQHKARTCIKWRTARPH